MKTNQDKPIPLKSLLEWANSLLKKWNRIETHIEAFGIGIQYCLIFHSYHPTKISLNKIFMDPKYPHHFKRNLQIFQDALKSSFLGEIIFDVSSS